MMTVNKDLDSSDSRFVIQSYEVGNCITEQFYTDSRAGRVIAVKRGGKEVTFQEDISTLDPSFKPVTIPGGFVGHCTNQNEQTYTYEVNLEGRTSTHTLRTWRGIKVWTRKGEDPSGRNSIVPGSRTFYDYNF